MIHPETLRLINDRSVIAGIKAHAIAEYPNESCGIIVPTGYFPLRNIAADPRHHFDCSAQIQPFQLAGELVSVVHSHPDGPEGPSSFDIAQQRAFGVPWGLLMCNHEVASEPYWWGDDLEPPPLEGSIMVPSHSPAR